MGRPEEWVGDENTELPSGRVRSPFVALRAGTFRFGGMTMQMDAI